MATTDINPLNVYGQNQSFNNPSTLSNQAPVQTQADVPKVQPQISQDSFGMSPDFVAKQQAKFSGTPAQAPEPVPVTPQSVAPVANAPKTEVATQTPEQRQTEILKNLSEGYTHAPQLFSNRQAFEQAYNFQSKPANEQAILDSFWKSKQQNPQTSSDYFKMFTSGAPIAPEMKSSPAFMQAQHNFSIAQQYMGATGDQLYSAVKSGAVTPGTDTWNYIMQANPQAVQAYQQKKSAASLADVANTVSSQVIGGVQAGNKPFYNLVKGAQPTQTPEAILQQISDKLVKGVDPNQYQDLLARFNAPEMSQQRNDIKDTAMQIADINAKIRQIGVDVAQELSGSGASESYKSALIAARTRDLQLQLSALSDKSNAQVNAFNAVKQDIQDQFSMRYQIGNQYANNLGQAAGIQQNIYGTQKQFENQKALYELQQAYTNPDINSKNPQIAQTAAQKMVADTIKFAQDNGIPVSRNIGQVLADAQTYATRNNVSLSQALQDTFTTPFTQKPEYQSALENIQQSKSPAGKLQVIGERIDPVTGLKVNVYGTVDKFGNVQEMGAKSQSLSFGTGTTDFTPLASKYPGVAAFKNNNPAGITWNANFDNGTGTAKALADAGISFEKGTARPSAEGGSYVKFASIEDGLAAQRIIMEKTYGNSTVQQMLGSWVGTSEAPAYAKQVSDMAGISPSVKVSSLTKEQLDALQIAKLKKESGGEKGLYKELVDAGIIEGGTINFPVQKGAEQQAQEKTALQYSSEQLALMQGIDSISSESRKALASAGLTTTDWAKFQDGQLPPTAKQKKTAQDLISSIEEIEKHPGFNDAVGFKGLQTGFTVPGTDKADFEALFNSLTDKMTLPNLGSLKGAMSDKDVEFLKNTATSLKTSMSEEQFKTTLNQIKQKYKDILNKANGQPSQDAFSATPSTIEELLAKYRK